MTVWTAVRFNDSFDFVAVPMNISQEVEYDGYRFWIRSLQLISGKPLQGSFSRTTRHFYIGERDTGFQEVRRDVKSSCIPLDRASTWSLAPYARQPALDSSVASGPPGTRGRSRACRTKYALHRNCWRICVTVKPCARSRRASSSYSRSRAWVCHWGA